MCCSKTAKRLLRISSCSSELTRLTNGFSFSGVGLTFVALVVSLVPLFLAAAGEVSVVVEPAGFIGWLAVDALTFGRAPVF